MAVRKYTLKRREEQLVFDSDEGEQFALLVEMDGAARDAYLDEIRAVTLRTKSGQSMGVKSFKGLHTMLLKRTLFKSNDDWQKLAPFTEAEIDGLPAGMQSELFDLAREVSGLGEDEEDEEGND